MTTKQSLLWTAFYVFAALLFSIYVYATHGISATAQYLTVFSLEKLLSMDNLLVMYIIFEFFGLTPVQQKKALSWGLFGALFFRWTLILSGTYIVNHLTWLLYLFAVFLIYSGYKMGTEEDGEYDPNESRIVSFLKNHTGQLGVFFACVIAIEISDIMFAVDSIPASFGVSQDSFVILSANLFAVLGLRSLYHAVANGIKMLSGIEVYIGAVLSLVGISVFVNHLWFKIPDAALMAAVFTILLRGFYACKKEKNDVVPSE